jgi:MATE family multidrug resistance protein
MLAVAHCLLNAALCVGWVTGPLAGPRSPCMRNCSRTEPGASVRQLAAWRGELVALLTLSGPIVLTNLAQIAMGITDVIMLGRLGTQALAAGALGTNLYFVAAIAGIGLTNATPPLIAAELGRNRFSVRVVRRTVRQGLWAATCIALPFWAVLWQSGPILRAMGQDGELTAQAAIYVRLLQWGLWPFLCFLVLRAFAVALERPRSALVVAVIAVGFNAIANECLIFGRLGLPAMGIAGSGLATMLSDCLLFGAMAAVILVDRRFRRYRLFGRFWRGDWSRFRAYWMLGLPMAAMFSFEVTVFNAAAFLMGMIGTVPLAAHAIAVQLAGLAFMVPLGIGQAVTVRVGRAFGAGDEAAIGRAGWTALTVCMVFMAAASATMLVAPRLLIGVFLDLSDPANDDVTHLAVSFLAMAALFQLADGAQAVGGGMLRGLQDARVPMLFALVGYWGIGLPLGIALAFGVGLQGLGIWIGLATGLTIVALLLVGRWIRRARLGLTRRLPS